MANEEITEETFLKRLNAIANELNVKLEEEIVLLTYFQRYPAVPGDVADAVFPIWFNRQ